MWKQDGARFEDSLHYCFKGENLGRRLAISIRPYHLPFPATDALTFEQHPPNISPNMTPIFIHVGTVACMIGLTRLLLFFGVFLPFAVGLCCPFFGVSYSFLRRAVPFDFGEAIVNARVRSLCKKQE